MLRVHTSKANFKIRIPNEIRFVDDFSTYKALFDTNIEYPDAIIATDIPVLTNLCSLWSITLLGPNDPEDHNKVAELSRSASRKGIILFDWRDTIPLDISAEQIERHILEYLQTGTFEDAVNLERISPPLGATKTRLCIFSDDRQGSLARVLGYISDFGINVHALTNQGNGDVGYSLIDITEPIPNTVLPELENKDRFPEIIRVREIQFY